MGPEIGIIALIVLGVAGLSLYLLTRPPRKTEDLIAREDALKTLLMEDDQIAKYAQQISKDVATKRILKERKQELPGLNTQPWYPPENPQ
jgi:hypothetical protein